jgi:hypothetical protein
MTDRYIHRIFLPPKRSRPFGAVSPGSDSGFGMCLCYVPFATSNHLNVRVKVEGVV